MDGGLATRTGVELARGWRAADGSSSAQRMRRCDGRRARPGQAQRRCDGRRARPGQAQRRCDGKFTSGTTGHDRAAQGRHPDPPQHPTSSRSPSERKARPGATLTRCPTGEVRALARRGPLADRPARHAVADHCGGRLLGGVRGQGVRPAGRRVSVRVPVKTTKTRCRRPAPTCSSRDRTPRPWSSTRGSTPLRTPRPSEYRHFAKARPRGRRSRTAPGRTGSVPEAQR